MAGRQPEAVIKADIYVEVGTGFPGELEAAQF